MSEPARRSDDLPWYEPSWIAYLLDSGETPPHDDVATKGVPPMDGGTPKTKGFFDKLGDALENATTPDTPAETVANIAKWAAIATCAFTIIYVAHKF
jgi:hypothetical protein